MTTELDDGVLGHGLLEKPYENALVVEFGLQLGLLINFKHSKLEWCIPKVLYSCSFASIRGSMLLTLTSKPRMNCAYQRFHIRVHPWFNVFDLNKRTTNEHEYTRMKVKDCGENENEPR